jgi:hypothetical protein
VQVLEFLAACAEFASRRRPDAGRFVHSILSRKRVGCSWPWPFAYRFQSFRAIAKIGMAGISGTQAKNPGLPEGEELPCQNWRYG